MTQRTTRRTKVSDPRRTIYRACPCGETAHDPTAEKIDGIWHLVFKCRNCRAWIVGPAHNHQ